MTGSLDVLADALSLPTGPTALSQYLDESVSAMRLSALEEFTSSPEWPTNARHFVLAETDKISDSNLRDLLLNPAFGGWLAEAKTGPTEHLLRRFEDLVWAAAKSPHSPPPSCGVGGVPRVLTGSAMLVIESRCSAEGQLLELPRVGAWELNGFDPLLNSASGPTEPLVAGTADTRRWVDALAGARDVMRQVGPTESVVAERVIRCLVPLKDVERSGGIATNIRHGTESFGYGAHAISLGKAEPWELAKALVHELHHAILNVVLATRTLLTPGEHHAVHYAPWRGCDRPIGALLHGIVAFWSEVEFLASLLELKRSKDLEDCELRALLIARVAELTAAAESAMRSNELADDGLGLVGAIQRRLADPVLGGKPHRVIFTHDVEAHIERWHRPGSERASASAGPAAASHELVVHEIPLPELPSVRCGDCGDLADRPMEAFALYDLGAVPWGSCEGHASVRNAPPKIRTVGLVAVDQADVRRLCTLLVAASAQTPVSDCPAVKPVVTVGELNNEGERWATVQLHFERASNHSWEAYFAQLEHASADFVRSTRELVALRTTALQDGTPTIR